MSRYRHSLWVVGLVLASGVVAILARPASASAAALPPSSGSQVISVERPAGQIAIADLSMGDGGRLGLTVTDTRADDPGWTVSVTLSAADQLGWKPYVVQHTAPYADSDGTVYAQEVVAGPSLRPGHARDGGIDDAVLGSAARGHGLGIAVLGAKLTAAGHLGSEGARSAPTVTITVV